MSEEIWAVTSYFNPVRYKNRLLNYKIFREGLRMPLLTIYLDFFGDKELTSSDAEIMVRLTEGDVMWQKERLFNLSLKHLPPSCQKIVWVDCDVIFPEDNWKDKVAEALLANPVVQPFAWVKHCRAQHLNLLKTERPDPEDCDEQGVAHLAQLGVSTANTRVFQSGTKANRAIAGIAWATRRDFIEEVGFYDEMIIGSGDVAFWTGVSGQHELFYNTKRPEGVLRNWLRWQEKAFALSQGQVGSVDSWVLNLWHGDHKHRGYADRWDTLCSLNFDPSTDLQMSTQGTWTWARGQDELKARLRDYFASRFEDGVDT